MVKEAQQKKTDRSSQLLSYLLLSVIWFALGWVASERLNLDLLARLNGSDSQALRIVDRAAELLSNRQYPKSLPSHEVAYNAVNGMLEFGNDPHAAFYKGLAAQRYREDFLGNSGTPGLYFTIEKGNGTDGQAAEDKFVIIEIVPGGPSEEAGLAVNDQILDVDGVPIDQYTSGNEVAILLRGPLEQPIAMTVLRDGEVLDFSVQRRSPTNLTATMLDNNIGYIRQRAFTQNVGDQFKDELARLSSQELDGLIWDLRGNRGGSMETAQQILSHFIAEGLLFTVQLKDGTEHAFESLGESITPTVPLVLLIDERTLSASETSALAIRDHKRGTIVGITSGGKGTVQETAPLDDGHLLHFTIGKWLSPTEQWINEIGVTPDIIVADDPTTEIDETLQTAVEHLRRN